jgi:hypothetical protein
MVYGPGDAGPGPLWTGGSIDIGSGGDLPAHGKWVQQLDGAHRKGSSGGIAGVTIHGGAS